MSYIKFLWQLVYLCHDSLPSLFISLASGLVSWGMMTFFCLVSWGMMTSFCLVSWGMMTFTLVSRDIKFFVVTIFKNEIRPSWWPFCPGGIQKHWHKTWYPCVMLFALFDQKQNLMKVKDDNISRVLDIPFLAVQTRFWQLKRWPCDSLSHWVTESGFWF